MKNNIVRVCYTPALYPLYMEDDCIVVIVDVLRATSAICTALQHGVTEIIPVASIEEALAYQGDTYIHAAERGGEIVAGFHYGNSPLTYLNNPGIQGKKLVLTTTNGTQAIAAAKGHGIIAIGAFSNISALTTWLGQQKKDVMILCSGWKNRYNLEDSLFAGALTDRLIGNGFDYDIDSDAAIGAQTIYKAAQHDLYDFLRFSSHRTRLEKLNLDEDVRYCLQLDTAQVVPVLTGDILMNVA